ncbi:MAG: hypothetical protein Q9224_007297, partial [Gallowayella concinna]
DAKARASPPPEQAALATLHNIGASASEIPSSFRYHDLDALLLSPQPERNKGQVLFLQGFLPQDWVTAIGSKYDIKPDFFKRHLDFSSQSDHRNAFSLPSLPSTRDNHFELNINTIFCHSTTLAGDESGNSTQKCRMKQEEQLSTYRRQLRAHARGGDSLVRGYSTLDSQYSVLEQRISICETKNGDGWLLIIWSDVGQDLAVSPAGPWTSRLGPQTSTFPIIQHFPGLTQRPSAKVENNCVKHVQHDANGDTISPMPQRAKTPQSTTLLPLDYQTLLSLHKLTKQAAHDPLLALAPIFTHSAASDVQFLNLLEICIDEEVPQLEPERPRHASLENIQHFNHLLSRHAKQIRQCLR